MAPAFDLTTTDRVNAMLSSGTPAPADTTYFGHLIAEVSAIAEQRLGRGIETVERTEEYDVHARIQRLELDSWPITAVSSVKFARDGDFASASALDADTYRFHGPSGEIIFLSWSFAIEPGRPAPRALEVTYTGGMATDQNDFISRYPDIVNAVTRQVCHFHQRRQGFGAGQVEVGRSTMIPRGDADLLPQFVETLRLYARPQIG